MTADPTPSPDTSPILESPLPRAVLTELYASMLRARMLSKRLGAPSLSEAVIAGALQNAEADDVLVSARPDPVLEVLHGGDLSALQRPKSLKAGSNGAAADSKVIVAGEEVAAGVAAGIATALKRQGSNALVLAFLQGAKTYSASWEQATQFASAQRTPVVFVADWTSSRAARAPKAKFEEPWPFPHIAVDGRDVIAVYRVTKEAISAARRGHGPTLVDAINFLAPGTRGRDDRDPIASFRGYLKRHDAWSEDWNKNLEASLKEEIGSTRSKSRS